MPNYEISEPTVARLLKWGTPLKDDMETVLHRVLEAAEAHRREQSAGGAQAAPWSNEQSQPRQGKRERTLHVLMREGLMAPGTELVLASTALPHSTGLDRADSKFQCKIGPVPRARENVIWKHDGRAYALSALTEKLRDEYGVPFNGGALNGYMWWSLASSPGKSLWDQAEGLRDD